MMENKLVSSSFVNLFFVECISLLENVQIFLYLIHISGFEPLSLSTSQNSAFRFFNIAA